MMTRTLPIEFADEVARILLHPLGAAGRIRDLETQAGHHVMAVGVVIPIRYPAQDWFGDSITSVAENGRDIRMVLLNARKPGTGAFTRLVANIRRAGFNPVVISPTGLAMPAIMAKWGWREHVIGSGYMSQHEWRPE